MTSFRRTNIGLSEERRALTGSKVWLHGMSLVSTGLRQLDEVCGGGLLLGSVLLLGEEEAHSSYSEYIFRYGIAESISNGCATLLGEIRRYR